MFVALVVLVVALVAPSPAPAGGVTLTEGAPEKLALRVPARLLERLSSQDAAAGEKFTFETTSQIEIEGVAVPSGTRGVGEVLEAQPARGARAGMLRLAVRELDPPSAAPIPVALAPGALDARLDPREPALTSASGIAVLGIGGRPAQTNIVYERGTGFNVIVTASAATPAPSPTPRRP